MVSVLWALIAAAWLYWLVAWFLLWRFCRRGSLEEGNDGYLPTVSVLKPVKGLDYEAYANYRSFCQQDYPRYQILFGLADPDDPAIPVIQQVQRDFPTLDIQLHVVPTTTRNRKAGLCAALAEASRYDLLFLSDSDVRVGSDYLRRVVAPLADDDVGMVTCPYRGTEALTLTARLEALHIGVTFLPSVVVANSYLGQRFALGASIALRRRELERIGGFDAVADYLADDYLLGEQVAKLGVRVYLSRYVVSCVLGPTAFRDQWQREVRWARCSAVSRPREYPGLLLTFCTFWSVVLGLATWFDFSALAALGVSLLLRWVVAWHATHLAGMPHLRRWLFLVPIRDMLGTFVWLAGLLGRTVVWRGERYRVLPDGRLSPAPKGRLRRAPVE